MLREFILKSRKVKAAKLGKTWVAEGGTVLPMFDGTNHGIGEFLDIFHDEKLDDLYIYAENEKEYNALIISERPSGIHAMFSPDGTSIYHIVQRSGNKCEVSKESKVIATVKGLDLKELKNDSFVELENKKISKQEFCSYLKDTVKKTA